MQEIISLKDSTLKIASTGQALIQASRPRGLQAPLQIGLGVQLHSQYASYNLLTSLHSMGFCCSYDEARNFEKNSAVSQGTYIPHSEHQFIQYSADNVDHNICTIDGRGTFHGMGIIANVTPGTKLQRIIPRLKITPHDVAQVNRIKIKFHRDVLSSDLITYK